MCSWSPVVELPETYNDDYKLIFVDVQVNVMSAGEDSFAETEQCDYLKELLTIVQSDTPLNPGTSWVGRVLLVVPTRPGYLARTKSFQGRFAACADLGILHDRTVVGQHLEPIQPKGLQALFDGCVLMLIRPSNRSYLQDDATVIEEVHARMNFPWLLDNKPKQKTLALVDGHLNLVSYLPLYISATALGIRLVVLDRPEHWISDPTLRHLYHDFIPIDMTVDDDFHVRIATAVKAYGNVDGICAIASACLAPVARAAVILGLPTESPDAVACASNKYQMRLVAGGADPTAIVTDVLDLKKQIMEKAFVPQYPLIVKPNMGAGSCHVRKVDTEAELLDGVSRTGGGSGKKVLIEAYIEGPELDVNFVLLDGEIIFFEISDDFPSPGDNGIIDGDFWENTNVLPSKLPATEYAVVRQELHRLLLQIGLRTGVFHLEARVQGSSMTFSEKDGLVDLRLRSNTTKNHAPRCVLIEINPRPPGIQNIPATAGTYGVNLYDLHLLSSLGDYKRFRALARPYEPDAVMPNHARAWSQIVFFKVVKGGICSSSDACREILQRLPEDDQELVTESLCFFRRGQRIPEPKPGIFVNAAFFIISSRRSRHDVLRVSRKLQQEFSIPTASV